MLDDRNDRRNDIKEMYALRGHRRRWRLSALLRADLIALFGNTETKKLFGLEFDLAHCPSVSWT
jgi:hypothetical protein